MDKKVTFTITFTEPEPKDTDSGLLSSDKNKTQYDKSLFFSAITSDSETSEEDEIFTHSLTSHTTASESTGTKNSLLPPESLEQNLIQNISILNLPLTA